MPEVTLPDEARGKARAAFQRAQDDPDMSWLGFAEDAAAEVAYAAGRADERARVVAWLHGRSPLRADLAADRIERGEHLGD